MTDRECQNDKLAVIDMTKKTILPNSIPPRARQISHKRLPVLPRIFRIEQIFDNPAFQHFFAYIDPVS